MSGAAGRYWRLSRTSRRRQEVAGTAAAVAAAKTGEGDFESGLLQKCTQEVALSTAWNGEDPKACGGLGQIVDMPVRPLAAPQVPSAVAPS